MKTTRTNTEREEKEGETEQYMHYSVHHIGVIYTFYNGNYMTEHAVH